jgi:class 3 adenylate cyclase
VVGIANSFVDDAPFVGRDRELARLDSWMAEARDGQLRIVAVRGEPGVGKTALIDEFTRRNRAGAAVHAGAFNEETGIPFLPILQAFDRPDLVGPPRGTANDDHQLAIGRDTRLFVELTDELLAPAATHPTILRLDDVHWADRASADLLSHLLTSAARQNAVEPVRLLVILTVRSTSRSEVAFLSRLAQERSHRTMDLGDLDELAVDQLLTELFDCPPSGRFRADIMEATDGNPLFVRELTDQLRRRGAIDVETGAARCNEDLAGSGIQLQHVLRDDVDRLSTESRELVTCASLMDTSLTVDMLSVASGVSGDDLDRRLDDAEHAQVLRELPSGELEFRHPVMRQLVAGDLTARRRRALHRSIADRLVLASDADDPPSQALRIAHHLRRAGPRADPGELAKYTEVAARESVRLGAWTKAARYAELAIEALGRLEGRDDALAEKELELRGIAALSHLRNHDPDATEEHGAAAIALARQVGHLDAWGNALVLDWRSRISLRPESLADILDARELHEFIEAAGDRAPRAIAKCWQLLAEMSVVTEGGDREAADRAVAAARESGDQRLLAWALFADGLTDYAALEPAAAIGKLIAGEQAARESGEDWILSSLLVRRALAHLMAGDLDAAHEASTEAEDLASLTHNWSEYGLALACCAQVAVARADLRSAERYALDALVLRARASSPYTAILAWPTLAYVRLLRSDRLGAADALEEWRGSGVRGSSRFRLLDGFGADDETLDLDRYNPASLRPPSAFDGGALVVDVDVALRTGDRELMQRVRQRLVELHERGVALLLPTATSTLRLIARIDGARGGRESARAALDTARTELERRGVRLEVLQCSVDQTAGEVSEPLDLAAVTALGRELDERSLLAPLETLRRVLPPEVGATLRPQRTVVVWDLVSSTPMLVDAGNEGYVDLVHQLNAVIERRLSEHGGLAFKYSGDGVFAWFLDAGSAMRCAVEVRNDLHDRNQRDGATALVVRTGIATGQPVDDDGDLFGLAVVIAARLCDRAGNEQILVAADASEASQAGLYAEAAGALQLKGIDDPVDVVDVSPLSPPTQRSGL